MKKHSKPSAHAPESVLAEDSVASQARQASEPLLGIVQPKGFPQLPEGWEMSWETIPNADRSGKLFSLTCRAKRALHPKRVLIVIHGQGEHCGRYLHLPHYLKSNVSEVCLFDLRGHGRSEGLRGHIDRFESYVEDAALFVQSVQARHVRDKNPVEFHLLGHSMGGLIALLLLRSRPEIQLASTSVSAPLLGLKMPVPLIKRAAAYGLSRLWGSLQLESELDPALVSRDVAVQEAYSRDRLVHSKATPAFFVGLEKAMAQAREGADGFRCPVQFLIPLNDEIVDTAVALDLEKKLLAPAKRLKTYEGFRHEPLNEVGKEAVFEDISTWIQLNPPKSLEHV